MGKKSKKIFIGDFCELNNLEILKKKIFFRKMQNFRKFWKIAYLWARFSPRRRQVGKNLMRRTGKEIFCRFRISNQIFHTIYGSRDIAIFGHHFGRFRQKSDLYGWIYPEEKFFDMRFFVDAQKQSELS